MVYSLKKKIWEIVEKEFNSDNDGTFRAAAALRTKYVNLKKATKGKIADGTLQKKKTGGGPYTEPPPFTETDNTILQIADSQVMGLSKSTYDCDRSKWTENLCTNHYTEQRKKKVVPRIWVSNSRVLFNAEHDAVFRFLIGARNFS